MDRPQDYCSMMIKSKSVGILPYLDLGNITGFDSRRNRSLR